MRQRNPSLGHHLHEISKAELEPKIPADTKDDDFPVEMAPFEKIINAQHPGVRPQRANLRRICPASAVCTRTHANSGVAVLRAQTVYLGMKRGLGERVFSFA